MISIITSVHNQLAMNKLYYEYLKKYTKNPFELIIIDNNSNDGSTEFFNQHADCVIQNKENYSYPYCQNQGLKQAKYDLLAFFNNDILVSPDWDEKIIQVMQKHRQEVISFATNEHIEDRPTTNKIFRKWKRIKYPVLYTLGTSKAGLNLMKWLMYGDWEQWTHKRYYDFGCKIKEGFSGSCIMMKKEALYKIGLWDERIQEADFDLFNRLKKRNIEKNDIKALCIALGVYIHHYQRLTLKAKPLPFADRDNLISLKEKWGAETRQLQQNIH